MKVCIIGFDSLDYELIKKFELKNIMQEEYGKVKISGILSTPSIWASFLTGMTPDEHGILGWKWDNNYLEKIKNVAIKLNLHKIFDKSKFLTKKVGNIGKTTPNIKGRIPTFFDYSDKSYHLDVPTYGEDNYVELRKDVLDALGNPILEKKVVEKSRLNFLKKEKIILNNLNKDFDLFMVHIYYPDVAQHLRFYSKEEIIDIYNEMDDTAKKIKEKLPKETCIIFLSDHGQEKGIHTPNAFYSCNQRLYLENPKITDFYNIILNKLGVPTREDIEIIKNRLEKLGYI